MNEIVKISYENDRPTVSGRELHETLEIATPYHKRFPRMCEYGFAENLDYGVTDIFVPNSNGGEQTQSDHQLSIAYDAAKPVPVMQPQTYNCCNCKHPICRNKGKDPQRICGNYR